MADSRQKFNLDYNNDSPLTQITAIDTFFQNNNIESWNVNNEVLEVSYNSGDATNPTRVTIIDYGVNGGQDIDNANSNATYNALVIGNQIIDTQLLGDGRFEFVQYREPPLLLEQNVNYKLPDDERDIASSPVYGEFAATVLGTQQTGINRTYVKIDQFNTIIVQKNLTVSAPNQNITIQQAGRYKIVVNLSFTGTTNTNFEITVHVNDASVTHLTNVRKTGNTPGDVGAIGTSGTVQLAINDVVDLRVNSDDVTGADFRVVRANFNIEKVR